MREPSPEEESLPEITKSGIFAQMNDFQSLENYIPGLSGKLLGFYELLEADTQIKLTEDLLDNYKAINAALAEACGLALKQPITGRQNVLKTVTSFRASVYALMIEEYNEKKLISKKKTFAPVAIGSNVFPHPN